MNTQDSQVRRLTFWNRFWLMLASIYALSGAYNFLFEHFTYDVIRLHLNWGYTDTPKQERALVVSVNQGGPFVVTHLVKQPSSGNEAAVATLSRPLFIPDYKTSGSKTRRYITLSELAKLVWVEESGKKVSTPKPGESVKALYYKVLEVTAKE